MGSHHNGQPGPKYDTMMRVALLPNRVVCVDMLPYVVVSQSVNNFVGE